ncbi:MAG: hypothetical protein U0797_23605 [Gemmataceae bacterium]
MPVEKFEVLERERGPRKGQHVYAVPQGQSVWLLGRVSLDGLWPKDVPLLFLVLAPLAEWGKTPATWDLYVASIMWSFRGPARLYRHQPIIHEEGVARWLHERRERAFIDVDREWLPVGTFPRDLAADILRLELPGLRDGEATTSGPFAGRLHVFLEPDYRAAGWYDDAADRTRDLGAGAAMTRPVSLYCPGSPTWGGC